MKEDKKFDLDIIATNLDEKIPFINEQVDLEYKWPINLKGSSNIKKITGVLQGATPNFIIILERNGYQHMILKENIIDMILRHDLIPCEICGWKITKSEFEAFGGRCAECDELRTEEEE